MAFEAFLESDDRRPRRRRRITYTASLLVHGALLAAGIAYSFWHVEEIPPPTLRVTFMSSVPPPPAAPPPPPAGGSAGTKKKVTTNPKTRPNPTELVQPRLTPPKKEEPKPEPDDDDPDQAIAGGVPGGKVGGVIGGKVGGVVGGVAGGTIGGAGNGPIPPPGAPDTGPKTLPPQMGALRRISTEEPDFPANLWRHSGTPYLVLAKICVSRTGTVDSVSIVQGADPVLDKNVLTTARVGRYRPLMANKIAIPFCYVGRYEFKSVD